MSFNCLQGWRLYGFSGQPIVEFALPHNLKASRQISYFVIYLSWTSEVFMHMGKIPLSLLQLSQPLLEWQMPQSRVIFVACPWTLCSGFMSHTEEPRTGYSTPDESHQGWAEGGVTSLHLLTMLCLMPENYRPLCKVHWWLNWTSIQGPFLLSFFLASLPQDVLVPPQDQDFAFPFAELFSSLFKSLWKSAQTISRFCIMAD